MRLHVVHVLNYVFLCGWSPHRISSLFVLLKASLPVTYGNILYGIAVAAFWKGRLGACSDSVQPPCVPLSPVTKREFIFQACNSFLTAQTVRCTSDSTPFHLDVIIAAAQQKIDVKNMENWFKKEKFNRFVPDVRPFSQGANNPLTKGGR